MDDLKKVSQLRKAAVQQNKERYRENSKIRLLNILLKKNKTTMIGAIASFEEHFGELWGHGKDDHELTPEQKIMKEEWHKARTEILDKGNLQANGIRSELNEYDVTWRRHTVDLPVISD